MDCAISVQFEHLPTFRAQSDLGCSPALPKIGTQDPCYLHKAGLLDCLDSGVAILQKSPQDLVAGAQQGGTLEQIEAVTSAPFRPPSRPPPAATSELTGSASSLGKPSMLLTCHD